MKHNIQNIFNKFINKYLDIYNPNYNQTKVINKITTCRTNKQGIRIYKCNHCHKKNYIYYLYKEIYLINTHLKKTKIPLNKPHKSIG